MKSPAQVQQEHVTNIHEVHSSGGDPLKAQLE